MMLLEKPRIDLTSRAQGGEPSSLSDVWSSTDESERLGHSSIGRAVAVDRAYTDRIDRIEKATGEKLSHPLDDVADPRDLYYPPAVNMQPVDDGSEPQVIKPRYDPAATFQKQLDETAEKHPAQRSVIAPDRSILDDAKGLTRNAERRASDVWERSDKGALAWAARLGGGFYAAMHDPVNIGTLAIGGGEAALGVKGLAWMALKQGAANAGAEAASQPFIQAWRKEAGLDYGISQAALDIGMAGVFGAGLDFAGRGLFRAGRRAVGRPYLGPDPISPADALDRAAKAAPTDSPLKRASEGDPDALRQVAKEAGLESDPVVKHALDEVETQSLFPAPERVDDGEHLSNLAKAIREESGAPELPAGDAIQPSAARDMSWADDAPLHPLNSVPDSAFNGDISHELERAVSSDRYTGDPIPLQNSGFHPDEIAALQRAGLADESGSMSLEQWREYDAERGRRVSPEYRRNRAAAKESKGIRVEGKPVGFRSLDPREVTTDASQFQFKSGGDNAGVTDRLRGVDRWDPISAGKAIVFERADGQMVIADGHQRLGLAQRMTSDGQDAKLDAYIFREKDGWTPEDVRAYAALKNMRESSGTSVDMAQVMRERPDLIDGSLPLSDAKLREATMLSRLSNPAFDAVIGGRLSPQFAALIGESVQDAGRHAGLIDELADANLQSLQQARLYLKQLLELPTTTETQMTLFGEESFTRTVLLERTKVLDSALRSLRTDKRIFGLLEKQAGAIEGAGNVLARDANAAKSENAAQLADLIEKLATSRGTVATILNDAAASVARGYNPTLASRAFVARIGDILERDGINGLVRDVEAIEPELSPRPMEEPNGPEAKAQTEELQAQIDAEQQSLFAIRAYHGTPHDFDRFDLGKIGTGEGAQVYGHGLYFAENEAVAQGYREALSPTLLDDVSVGTVSAERTYSKLKQAGKLEQEIASQRRYVQKLLDDPNLTTSRREGLEKQISELDVMERVQRAEVSLGGKLYEVEIDVKPEQLLDWDKPLAEQSASVRRALQTFADRIAMRSTHSDPIERRLAKQVASGEASGGKLMSAISASPAEASRVLKDAGIPGLRYLDQGSRDAAEGTRNIVIFDDSLVKITHKNGEPVSAKERAQAVEQMFALPHDAGRVSPSQGGAIRLSEAIKRFMGEVSAATERYDYVGIRVTEDPLSVGDTAPSSRIWRDDVATGEMLDGASAIAARADERSIERAIRQAGVEPDIRAGYYHGEYVSILGSARADAGEDAGEIIMKSPVVLATFKKPRPGSVSEIADMTSSPGKPSGGSLSLGGELLSLRNSTLSANAAEQMAGIRADIDKAISRSLPVGWRAEVRQRLVFGDLPEGMRQRNPGLPPSLEIEGTFDPYERIVYVSMAALDPVERTFEEVGHALKALGLIPEPDYAILRAKAQEIGARERFRIDERYGDVYGARWKDDPARLKAALEEEAIFQMAAARARGDDFGKQSNSILDKLIKFFRAIRDMLGIKGFRTFEDVFADMTEGGFARPVSEDAGLAQRFTMAGEVMASVGKSTSGKAVPESLANEHFPELGGTGITSATPVGQIKRLLGRLEAEQEKRRSLLADSAKLNERADEVELAPEAFRKLVQDNFDGSEPLVAELNGYLSRPDVVERGNAEKKRSSSFKFTNVGPDKEDEISADFVNDAGALEAEFVSESVREKPATVGGNKAEGAKAPKLSPAKESKRIRDLINQSAAEGKLSREDANDLLKRFTALEKQHKSPVKAKTELTKEIDAEAAHKKRQQALSEAARIRIEKVMRGFRDARGQADPAKAMVAMIENLGQHELPEGTVGVANQQHAIYGMALSELDNVLHEFRKTIVTGHTRNKARLSNVVRELFGEGTGDKSAAEFAKAAADVMEKLRQRFNAAGGAIGKRSDFGMPQHHDPVALIRAGKDAWVKYITPLLDGAKMKHPLTGSAMAPADLQKSLSWIYDNIVSDGWHEREAIAGFKGLGSTANQRGDHRFLVFKDADAWMKYAEMYGNGPDPLAVMVNHIRGMSKDIAAMEVLGPNPSASLAWMQQVVTQQAARRAAGMPAVFPVKTEVTGRAMRAGGGWIVRDPREYARRMNERATNMFAFYNGSSSGQVGDKLAEISQTVRNVNVITKLGGATISALGDPFWQLAARKFAGLPVMKTLPDILRQVAAGGEREARRAGVISETYLHMHNEAAREAAALSATKISSVLAERVISLSGLTTVTRAGNHAMGMAIFAHMADQTSKGFPELSGPVQRLLRRYGLAGRDWDAIRLDVQGNPAQGDFLTPTAVREALVARKQDTTIAERYLAMALGESQYATAIGTLRARAMALGNTKAGTGVGEIYRHLAQFKSFAVNIAILQIERIAREFVSQGLWRGAQYGAYAAISATLGGALIIQLKQLIAGKDPRAMVKPNGAPDMAFWTGALQQSGGLSIWGDLLYASQNRFGGGIASTIAGPTAAMAEDIANLTYGAAQKQLIGQPGQKTNYGRELSKFVRNTTPGASLWYVRLAWNRVLMDNLQRMMDPEASDAFSRQMQNARKDYGQRFWFQPGKMSPSRVPDLRTMVPLH